MLVAIITFAAFVLNLYRSVHHVRALKASGRPVPRVAVAWAVFFGLVQLFIGVWAAIGLVQDDVVVALVLNFVFLLCGAVNRGTGQVVDRLQSVRLPCMPRVLSRVVRRGKKVPASKDAKDAKGTPAPAAPSTAKAATAPASAPAPARRATLGDHPIATSIALLLIAALLTCLGLEFPSNHDLGWMYPLCALLEWTLVAVLMLGSYFLLSRRAIVPAVLAFALWVVGVAEHFVITFKSMPIAPGDLSALSTAAAVAGSGYTYTLTPYCLYGLVFALLALLVCRVVGAMRPLKAERTRKRLIVNVLVGVVLLGGFVAHVTLVDYYNTLGIQVYTWRPLESYYREGFLPSFISGAQTIKPPRPKGYSVSHGRDLVTTYAKAYDKTAKNDANRAAAVKQFSDQKPTVITIMNETFSDLSIYDNLHANYQGPRFFKSLSDTLQRGRLYVSAYGGGTANTEFEYLTGNSMANLGSGVYPYTIYNLSRTPNLAAQFKKLGYKTTAMHPNHGTNWNRANVYQDFGFDQFLTINDFQGAETLRNMVTDRATYDKILSMLRSDSTPQFIFDVTMQNHSGYDTGLIPADKQVNYTIDGVSDPEVNEYLALIEQSDQALEYFVNQLRELDRPVILVFFGDHQPFFPSKFNDAWFTGEDEATHAERLWQTDYIIWANYDVAGRDQVSTADDLSTNFLGSTLLDLIGAPLTNYEKAHLSLRASMPAINATGYEDKSLRWYLSSAATHGNFKAGSDGANATKARDDFAMMQYYELFGDGKNIYTQHYQDAANETDPNLKPGTTQIK